MRFAKITSALLIIDIRNRYWQISAMFSASKNWLLAVILAILLRYTNCLGGAIPACVFLDYIVQTRNEPRQHWPHILFAALLLVIVFRPLMPAFLAEIDEGRGMKTPVLERVCSKYSILMHCS